jgi:heme exporter protein D
MVDFFKAGGFSMFILLAIGAGLVPFAIAFARTATPQRLSIIRALTVALVFATLTGFVSNLAATAKYVAHHDDVKDPLPILLQGFSESCAALLLGGGIATIAWILVAVGIRRMPPDHS